MLQIPQPQRFIRILLAAAFLGYLPLLAISYFVEPELATIDVFVTQERGDQASVGLFGYRFLASSRPKIALMGASGVMHGMRPDDFERELPSYQAGNFAVSGTNVSGIRQMVQGVRAITPEPARSKSVYVVGVFFGTFIENHVRYGRFRKDKLNQPDCIEEILKFSTLRRINGGDDGLEPRYPWWLWSVGVHLWRPFGVYADRLSLDSAWYDGFVSYLRTLVRKSAQLLFPVSMAHASPLAKNRQEAVDFWPRFMDRTDETVSDEQFEELLKLRDDAEKYRLQIVLVDLPIADWHRKNSKLFFDYQDRKKLYLSKIASSRNMTYLNLQHLSNESYFTDSVHVSQQFTQAWAHETALAIRAHLTKMETSP